MNVAAGRICFEQHADKPVLVQIQSSYMGFWSSNQRQQTSETQRVLRCGVITDVIFGYPYNLGFMSNW